METAAGQSCDIWHLCNILLSCYIQQAHDILQSHYIEKTKNPKKSKGMPILSIRSLTRSLKSTRKRGFRNGTDTQAQDSRTLRLRDWIWRMKIIWCNPVDKIVFPMQLHHFTSPKFIVKKTMAIGGLTLMASMDRDQVPSLQNWCFFSLNFASCTQLYGHSRQGGCCVCQGIAMGSEAPTTPKRFNSPFHWNNFFIKKRSQQ